MKPSQGWLRISLMLSALAWIAPSLSAGTGAGTGAGAAGREQAKTGLRTQTKASADTAARTSQPHLLLVSVDGLKADSYVGADARGSRIPTLRHLMREGAWARASQPVFPPMTYPSHASLVTGVTPLRHQIATNTFPELDGRPPGEWRWYAHDLASPPLWSLARQAGLRTGAISWPVTVGADIDYLIPEYVRYGLPHDLKLLDALARPQGLASLILRSGEAPGEASDVDTFIEQAARTVIERWNPNLTLVHLVHLDSAQHSVGPESPAALEALEAVDARLGRLWATARKRDPKATMLVVSDHGFAPVSRTAYPNHVLTEAGPPREARFVASGGVAALYFSPRATPAQRQACLDRARSLPARYPHLFERVLERTELDHLQGLPGATLAVTAVKGVSFSSALGVQIDGPALERGSHGYAPSQSDQQAAFLAIGRGIRRGAVVDQLRVLDVAPTAASLLGLPVTGMQGQTAHELLEPRGR